MCSGSDSDVQVALLNKAIQESLLQAVGVKINLPRHQFERRLDEYLMEHGSKGLIQLFLTAYLNAVTWFILSGPVGAISVSAEKRKQLMREIDSAASRKVQSITARWRMWPRMDVRDAEVVSTALEAYLFGDEGSIPKWQEIIRSHSSSFSA
jgi:membrane protein required for beta-lactamase induction